MKVAIAALAAMLVLAACDTGGTGDEAAPGTDGAAERPDGDADAGTDDADAGAETDPDAVTPDLPDVTTIDPADVEDVGDAADADVLDASIASSAADLPDGWLVHVVPDPTLGPYVVGLPEASRVWRVGDDLDPLRDAATDEAWLTYWEPILTEASDAVETSSLRAAAVVDGGEAGELHLTVSATPRQDLPVDDPATLAEAFAEAFAEQRLDVEDVRTERAGELEVGAITATTPDDEFEDGVPRRLVQWFFPEADAPVVWSVTCEAAASEAAVSDEVCAAALASFRTPPR